MEPEGIAETLITQLLDERAPRSSDASLDAQCRRRHAARPRHDRPAPRLVASGSGF